jgi:hypothetical protein
MLSLNPEAIVKDKLKKLDLNHDGHADIPVACDKIKAGCEKVDKIIARISVAEAEMALRAFNAAIGNKLTEAEIHEGAEGFAEVHAGLVALEHIADSVKKELS